MDILCIRVFDTEEGVIAKSTPMAILRVILPTEE